MRKSGSPSSSQEGRAKGCGVADRESADAGTGPEDNLAAKEWFVLEHADHHFVEGNSVMVSIGSNVCVIEPHGPLADTKSSQGLGVAAHRFHAAHLEESEVPDQGAAPPPVKA